MVEIPFYHIFSIADKVRRGADVTNDDIAKLVGDPGYHLMKYLDNVSGRGTLRGTFAQGPNRRNAYYNAVRFRGNAYTSFKARQRRFHKYRKQRFANRRSRRGYFEPRSVYKSEQRQKRFYRNRFRTSY